ncbi:hypothetical protein BDN70DRAFT_820283 [Pholiota conissans]|uniref:CxC2-like cysteine cluster KDZ transposase-associated domain-containing protein n=1 Tax=Pholiota conissans TaxID=109636 RepID=A0A9P5YLX5_9AGAR|nr:hypothetical protein BDN70DRAFT_820283 [Pholiota conissans]
MPYFCVPITPSQRQKDYSKEFASRVKDFLDATMLREIPDRHICSSCDAHAVWQCRDCTLPGMSCRKCMRKSHLANPLHRIQCWTGSYFRDAELWEVGGYIISTHSNPSILCASLTFQDTPQETAEYLSDTPMPHAMHHFFVRVVHTNGLHYIPLVHCTCQGTERAHTDLIASRLVPTSFVRYSTLFTMAVLDDFRMANLECKTSAYQYFQKLRRLTSPMAPAGVPNRYPEFRRMARLWRWFKHVKWAGFAHTRDDTAAPSPGQLTLFCPACPQPNINLPKDWMEDTNQNVYIRFFVADGNFKADHVRQKSGDTDIWLSEGGGMMPPRKYYQAFLGAAENLKAPCQANFRVLELAMMLSKACDKTGVVSVACARHGCFAPNSLVDLSRGEQQRNVDFAFLAALRNTHTEDIRRVMFLYDIACQYHINIERRIGDKLPEGLQIDYGIGMFHVHAHQEECFHRFTPSFIPGAGNVAGEILESLWSGLNPVSSSTRTMTLAARAATLEDHTSDNNFKKTIGMAGALYAKYLEAQQGKRLSEVYYEKFCGGLDSEDIVRWNEQITCAEDHRKANPKAMDILKAQTKKPAAVEKAEAEVANSSGSIIAWFKLAFVIEEKQQDINDRVRRLRREPREPDRQKIEDLRREVVSEFEVLSDMQRKIGVELCALHNHSAQTDLGEFNKLEDDGGETADPEETGDNVDTLPEDMRIPPEARVIPFPSNESDTDVLSSKQTMRKYRKQELDYRIRRAEILLARIRQGIADKSFQYSHIIRAANTKTVKTRGHTASARITHNIVLLAKLYTTNRVRLIQLDVVPEVLSRFKKLGPGDVDASTAVVNPNQLGSKQIKLSWIWLVDAVDTSNPEGLREFQRVHYLRARATRNRWAEEFRLVRYEMQWTVNYFRYQAEQWNRHFNRATEGRYAGAAAYALRKVGMWEEMARRTEERIGEAIRMGNALAPNYPAM